jgi:hypothetical protein
LPLAEYNIADSPKDRTIAITFDQLKRMHRTMAHEDNYDRWLDQAPQLWKADSFFRDRIPIFLLNKYGQDTRLDTNEHQTRDSFVQLMRWEQMLHVSVAIATQIRCALSKYCGDFL